MIRGIAAIFKRELRVHFFSLSNLLLAALFSAVAGLFFFANISDWSSVSLGLKGGTPGALTFDDVVTGPFFMNLCLVVLATSPLLSARVFTEEKRSGTFELFFTYPVHDLEIVLGKWFALLFQMTFLMLPAFCFFQLLNFFNVPLHQETILNGFLGIWLIAAFAASIGLFFSASCQNQALALIFSFVALLFFWTNGWLGDLFIPKYSRWMSECWSAYHMKEFASGILDTNRLLFYGLGCALMITLSTLALELRTWRR